MLYDQNKRNMIELLSVTDKDTKFVVYATIAKTIVDKVNSMDLDEVSKRNYFKDIFFKINELTIVDKELFNSSLDKMRKLSECGNDFEKLHYNYSKGKGIFPIFNIFTMNELVLFDKFERMVKLAVIHTTKFMEERE